jgi:serine/threonine protein kinase
MRILKLFKRYWSWMAPHPADEIGSGIDGEVYSMLNDPDRVIKICQVFDFDRFDATAQVLDKLLFQPLAGYARVYMRGTRRVYKKGYVLYFYVMEKLQPISEDESKVFHTILSHEDRNIIKDYAWGELEKILEGLRVGLDFDTERVKFLCQAIRHSPIKHLDIHPRNIMKNADGDFKLIDFDRVQLKEED